MTGFVDIHCHILPGVDDGAPSREVSRQMLAAARMAGVTALVATPHVYDVRAGLEGIRKAFDWFAPYARSEGIFARLGYEVNFRVLADVEPDGLRGLCVEGTNCLLLELPDIAPFPGWLQHLKCLAGIFDLIIVHPERCAYLAGDMCLAQELIALGCEMQVDAGALGGPFFRSERRAVQKLIKMELAHYVASDAHCPQDYAALPRAMRAFVQKPGKLTDALQSAWQGN